METIEKVLDNAFKINRIHTKAGNFIRNEFTRPVTGLDFFQLLSNSEINLTSNDLIRYITHITATNYTTNWKSSIKLIISENSARISISGYEHLNIELDFNKLKQMYKWFQDSYIFHKDFGSIYKSSLYYLKSEIEI